MIKIVCDKCGKEITLRYFEQGLESLPGWATSYTEAVTI